MDMKVFGVTLRAPSPSDWMLVPLVGALSAYLAALIHQHLGGASLAPVAGLAAAGAIGTALALAGADTEAGWRGVARARLVSRTADYVVETIADLAQLDENDLVLCMKALRSAIHDRRRLHREAIKRGDVAPRCAGTVRPLRLEA